MWRALTLKAREPDGTYSDNVTPTSWLSSKEDLRKAYWATTFRSLGDVVHLLQDMAQPQHTRNDSHSGFACVPVSASCLAGHDSFFEKYIRARTLRSAGFQLAEALAPPAVNGDIKSIAANPLDYDSYPIAISSPAPSPTPPASSTTSSAAN